MTKMKRTVALVAAVAGLGLVAGGAQAIASVDVIWKGTTSSTAVSPAATSVITASFILRGDATGVFGIGFTIQYDTVELDAIGIKENAGSAAKVGKGNQFAPLVAGGTIDDLTGTVLGFDSAAGIGAPGCVNCTITLGSVQFHVANAANGPTDRDVIVGFFNAGVDGAINAAGGAVPVQFGDAAVTGPTVPEPTTALLVVGGLLGLGYAGRRSSR